MNAFWKQSFIFFILYDTARFDSFWDFVELCQNYFFLVTDFLCTLIIFPIHLEFHSP